MIQQESAMVNDTLNTLDLKGSDYKKSTKNNDIGMSADETVAEEVLKKFGVSIFLRMNMKKIEEREYFQKLNRP